MRKLCDSSTRRPISSQREFIMTGSTSQDRKCEMLTMLTLCFSFTDQLTKDSSKIKANIRMVLEGLRELQGLSDLPESRRREVY
ncbi:Protein UXT [Larimichthys crocea]|uniref:Uncharacterized protein n=1 Tax=Larimichthys crocea TaxID=215358 RepID=A0ACD3RB13_LARCR|nr:Protein UXT [Larimichthys crocea]